MQIYENLSSHSLKVVNMTIFRSFDVGVVAIVVVVLVVVVVAAWFLLVSHDGQFNLVTISLRIINNSMYNKPTNNTEGMVVFIIRSISEVESTLMSFWLDRYISVDGEGVYICRNSNKIFKEIWREVNSERDNLIDW